MRKVRALRVLYSFAGVGLFAGVAAIVLAAPALAAPYADQSSAQALQLTAVGSVVAVDTGTQTAIDDGSTATVTSSSQPLLTVLGTQTVVTAGVLAQTAVANSDGTTAACAGVSGQGGGVQLGDQTDCVTPGTSGIGLNLGATVSLSADAVYASCAGTPGGATGTAHLANASLALLGIAFATLDADPAPNTSITPPQLSGLLSVVLNKQTTGGTGQITVTALSITALSGLLASVDIGTVSCGPAADLAAVPAVPKAGMGIAAGTLAGAGLIGFVIRRRRSAAASAA